MVSVTTMLQAADAFMPELAQANPDALSGDKKLFKEYRDWLQDRDANGHGGERSLTFNEFAQPRLANRYNKLPGTTPSERKKYASMSPDSRAERAKLGGVAFAMDQQEAWGQTAGGVNAISGQFTGFIRQAYPDEVAAEAKANAQAASEKKGSGSWLRTTGRWGAALAGAAAGLSMGGIIGAVIGFIGGLFLGNVATEKFGPQLDSAANTVNNFFNPKSSGAPAQQQANAPNVPKPTAKTKVPAHTTITEDMVKNSILDSNGDGTVSRDELKELIKSTFIPDPSGIPAEDAAKKLLSIAGATEGTLDASKLDALVKKIEMRDKEISTFLEGRSINADRLKDLLTAPKTTPAPSGPRQSGPAK